MRLIKLAFLFGGATALLASGIASASTACRNDAQQVFKACKQSCRDDYLAARLTCRNVDPSCGTACVDGRRACAQQVENVLETGQIPGGGTLANCDGGTDACDAALLAGKQGCWNQYCDPNSTCTSCAETTDPTSCYECVDPYQETAFGCRDTCRDSFRQDSSVKSMKAGCKTFFQGCLQGCPPPPAP